MNSIYYNKYIKYKNKYLNLFNKLKIGGSDENLDKRENENLDQKQNDNLSSQKRQLDIINTNISEKDHQILELIESREKLKDSIKIIIEEQTAKKNFEFEELNKDKMIKENNIDGDISTENNTISEIKSNLEKENIKLKNLKEQKKQLKIDYNQKKNKINNEIKKIQSDEINQITNQIKDLKKEIKKITKDRDLLYGQKKNMENRKKTKNSWWG